MRRTSNCGDVRFPYLADTTCWVLVADDDTVTNPQGKTDRLAAVQQAQTGGARLFMAWPGRYRTDLFEVDDLDEVDGLLTPMTCQVCGERIVYAGGSRSRLPDGTWDVDERWQHRTGSGPRNRQLDRHNGVPSRSVAEPYDFMS